MQAERSLSQIAIKPGNIIVANMLLKLEQAELISYFITHRLYEPVR
jgi:hypothetical protein